MVSETIDFVIFLIFWVSLILFSSWFLFRTIVFLKILPSTSKVKQKFFFFTELFYNLVILALVFVLIYFISLMLTNMISIVSIPILVIGGFFILYVLIKSFSFPVKDSLYFINNIDDVLKRKFKGVIMSSIGYLWTHLIAISEISNNRYYQKIEGVFRIFVNIGIAGFITVILGFVLVNLEFIGEFPIFFVMIVIFGIISIALINRLNKKRDTY